MLIQGNMMSFAPSTKVQKKGGGTYDAWELVYRSTDNEVKSVVKPAGGLKFKPLLKDGLVALAVGDPFTMVMEKENDYWTPQSVEKGIRDVQDMAAPGVAAEKGSDGNRAPAREGRVVGSNYETPEERAKKQVVITRMGVLNTAVAFSKDAKIRPSQEELISFARDLEIYVYNGLDAQAKAYLAVTLKEEPAAAG